MPYLIRDSFNATSGLIFAALVIVMFVSSSNGGVPEWVGMTMKLSALLFIVIDVIVRKFTFKINIDEDSFSYACRGVIDSHKCRFKLKDIEAIDVRRQWHYRVLGLSVLDVSTIGSRDSVIKDIVLRRKDADKLCAAAQGGRSLTGGTGNSEVEGVSRDCIFKLSVLRILMTPLLTPWRRSLGDANYWLTFPVALFFISMLATNGNVSESINATIEATSSQASADQGMLEELLSNDFGAHLDFRDAIDSISLAITVFFITFLIFGRFTVNSLKSMNYRTYLDGDCFVVESGFFDIHKYQFKVSQFSSYEFDDNWLYRYFGYTRLRIFNRDDGSAYASPLINKKEMELIILNCKLPMYSPIKVRSSCYNYAGRIQKIAGVMSNAIFPAVLCYVCLPHVYKNGSGVTLTSLDGSIGTGSVILLPFIIFFIYASLPRVYNFLCMKVRYDKGIYAVVAWDKSAIVAVFCEREVLGMKEEGVVCGTLASYYMGKKKYSGFKNARPSHM
jgi:hypothetical protein